MSFSVSDEMNLFSQELQNYLSPSSLQQLAKEVGFVQRKSKYQAQELIALCVWLSQQVASTPLTQLCSHLEASTGVLMSPEGLNQRFNGSAVQFLQQVLANLLTQRIHSTQEILHPYSTIFKRIRILDSTTFQLPDKFASHYQGSGGSSHTAGVKIQLEYDLLSGKFLHVYVGEGRENDKTFGSTSLQIIQPKDLYIRDLGYFDLHDLKKMNDEGAYYVSRLKLNSRIYRKNNKPEFFRNGTVKKGTLFIQLDTEELMNQLQPGQTLEISEAYIGLYQKLPARVIIHRLTESQTEKRLKEQAKKEKKKGITYKDRSKRLSGMNVYITNLSLEEVPTEHIHDLYSLRWQIEILFKTWKSFFQIDKCKEIKRERLECHLYGQLISILLCSSTMFKMRQLLLDMKKKKLSEYKSIYMIKDYYLLFYQGLQKDTQELSKTFLRLFYLLEKNGRKCHRYNKKTVFDILGVVYDYSMSQKLKVA
ncbi:IS4 family transposase [Bacillus sp. ISL-101]|uniref:IS4 family transposase n=1 Tax=unclassified Bacillus (in: firmicutes) TaxID=185979 RepID=UPI001BE63DEB|nr:MULTISPECIES: IS4 family transposase [unclassified Bacillus (in: firmicutes)]MBT2629232.1 IS4 family transposase [Bacillus sp. ISL-101]MBT2717263.1 IS4 family transposase [Bacillus sp. ISL-57]